jgi:lipopolysaccharide transport system permease protein
MSIMARTETILEPGRTEAHYWRDLWRYRELFGFLAWRDVLVRYKQTAIGVAWGVLRPLLTMLVFVFFRRMTGLHATGVPESIFVLSALLPWQFFSNALSESSQSLVGNANLISKIYFPRMILPASSVIVALVDFAITLMLLALLMAWHQFWPTWRVLVLAPLTVLAIVSAIGPGLLITALNVKYRDFRYVIPFIVQFGLFVSPIAFSTEEVARHGEAVRMLFALNPMVAVIDGFRWAICGADPIDAVSFAVSLGVSCVLFVVGVRYFRRTERTFADVI